MLFSILYANCSSEVWLKLHIWDYLYQMTIVTGSMFLLSSSCTPVHSSSAYNFVLDSLPWYAGSVACIRLSVGFSLPSWWSAHTFEVVDVVTNFAKCWALAGLVGGPTVPAFLILLSWCHISLFCYASVNLCLYITFLFMVLNSLFSLRFLSILWLLHFNPFANGRTWLLVISLVPFIGLSSSIPRNLYICYWPWSQIITGKGWHELWAWQNAR